VIDAQGAYVTPGGVDSHVHVDQADMVTGDTWLTGTRSAICGGTTTVIAFAQQKRADQTILPTVEKYSKLAENRTFCDYSFHLILTNPTKHIVDQELPVLVSEWGITSVKLYMTYEPLKLNDFEILQVMRSTRRLGMTTMVHAENSDMIAL
jgi:dihydropyrimidinase